MIRLEPFTPADFTLLRAWVDSHQLLREWSGGLFAYPLSEDALHWYLEGANVPGESDVFIYKAVDSKTGQTLAHVSLGNVSDRDRSARLTRVLVGESAQRGRGVCTQMIRAVLRIGFEELGLHRISLGVYTFNHGAIRCYLKAGFKKEGVLRDVVRHGDDYWSMVEMGILEDEWRELPPPPSVPDSHPALLPGPPDLPGPTHQKQVDPAGTPHRAGDL